MTDSIDSIDSTETTDRSASDRITMYGAQWCGDCRRSQHLLAALEIDYDYVDLETVTGGADAALAISGRTQIPVIAFPDGTHVVEPSDSLLHAKLTQLGRVG